MRDITFGLLRDCVPQGLVNLVPPAEVPAGIETAPTPTTTEDLLKFWIALSAHKQINTMDLDVAERAREKQTSILDTAITLSPLNRTIESKLLTLMEGAAFDLRVNGVNHLDNAQNYNVTLYKPNHEDIGILSLYPNGELSYEDVDGGIYEAADLGERLDRRPSERLAQVTRVSEKAVDQIMTAVIRSTIAHGALATLPPTAEAISAGQELRGATGPRQDNAGGNPGWWA